MKTSDLVESMVKEVLVKCLCDSSATIKLENKYYRVKAYQVNSSAKYANPSIRIDIQDLEPRDYA